MREPMCSRSDRNNQRRQNSMLRNMLQNNRSTALSGASTLTLLAAGLLLAIAPARARADVTPISSCPYTISQPGQYHITQDLTCPVNGTAITISANDVELHFDGHTLDGGGTGG